MSGLAHKKARLPYLPTLPTTPSTPRQHGNHELVPPERTETTYATTGKPMLHVFASVSYLQYCFGNW